MTFMKRISVALCIISAIIFAVPADVSESVAPGQIVLTVQAASKVKLSKTKAVIKKGSTLQLKLNGTKKKAKWSSSDKKVAAVSSHGKVTAKKKGTATITARLGQKKYRCKITVKAVKTQQTAHKHSYTERVTSPTCTKRGYTTYSCSGCSYSYKDKYTEAFGHSYAKNTVSASKNGKGYTLYTCSRCQKSYKGDYTDYQPSESQVYEDIVGLRTRYPQGMKWNNDDYYGWRGGIYSGGYGCAGFAFMLSDEAFGYLPARMHKNFSEIRVGDIVRMNNDGHSVIVLEVNGSGAVVAEGNLNNSVYWGRQISFSEILSTGTYVMTRYPD
ncbi:MAG: Ig-like domain-containing protein [Dorea sp.]|nr:Ig-like domain-containing protein [Dorea sp.]